MDPRELKSESEWRTILETLSEESGMKATLTDDSGKILLEVGRRFPLCEQIRDRPEALAFICSQSSSAMRVMLQRTLRPLVDECDAGLWRLAVPVLDEGGAFAGQVIACGVKGDDVDTFLVSKQLDLGEAEIEELAQRSEMGDEAQLEALAARCMAEINGR